jgi:hypothetical protein
MMFRTEDAMWKEERSFFTRRLMKEETCFLTMLAVSATDILNNICIENVTFLCYLKFFLVAFS